MKIFAADEIYKEGVVEKAKPKAHSQDRVLTLCPLEALGLVQPS